MNPDYHPLRESTSDKRGASLQSDPATIQKRLALSIPRLRIILRL